MIAGIGTDILNINRIEKSYMKFSQRLLNKILSQSEIEQFKKHKTPIHFLAKRFAAKEALFKALGTGYGKGLFFHHIAIKNDKLGKPFFVIENQLAEIMKKNNWKNIEVSISDEKDYAIAFVVIEK